MGFLGRRTANGEDGTDPPLRASVFLRPDQRNATERQPGLNLSLYSVRALWNNADPNIPVLKEAKAEYARMLTSPGGSAGGKALAEAGSGSPFHPLSGLAAGGCAVFPGGGSGENGASLAPVAGAACGT